MKSALLRAAGLIAVVTIVARIAGFARYLVFGGSVGAGEIGTAYASANLLPNILFEVAAGGALVGVAIPVIAGPIARRDLATANRVTSALLTWTLALLVPIAVAVTVFAEPLATAVLGWNAGEDNTDQIALATTLLHAFAWQIPLYGVNVVLAAYLQATRRFFWPALVPLLSSLTVMATYRLYAVAAGGVTSPGSLTGWAQFWLGWGTTLGVVALSLPLLLPVRRAGFSYRPAFSFPAGIGARVARLAGSGLTAVAAQQALNALVLLTAMRAGGDGTLPIYQYAQAVYLLPYAILIIPLVTSVFPHLAELHDRGESAALGSTVAWSLRMVAALGALGAAVLWASAPSVEVFFRLIDRAHVSGVGPAVGALALGLGGYAVMMQACRILYVLERTADAVLVGSIGWITAGVVIFPVVIASPQRPAAHAAVVFALGIALGMIVAALVSIARVTDIMLPSTVAMLRRSIVVAVGLAVIGGGAGWTVTRALQGYSTPLGATVLIGILGALVAAAIVAGGTRLLDPDVLTGLRDPDAAEQSAAAEEATAKGMP